MPAIKPTSDTSCDMRKSPTVLDADNLRANMMEIKSSFMNETNDLSQETSSLQLVKTPTRKTRSIKK